MQTYINIPEEIWSKNSPHTSTYSQSAKDLMTSMIDASRASFERDFTKDLEYRRDLYIGMRFKDDSQILWVLESNVSEADFKERPKQFLAAILKGAASADYFYKFEKQY